MERPQLSHLANVGAVHVGGIGKAGDLVHLLPEAKGQLPRHRAGEGKTEVLPGGDVHLRVERVSLWNADRQTLRVDPLVGVTVLATQDGVTKAPAITMSETLEEKTENNLLTGVWVMSWSTN